MEGNAISKKRWGRRPGNVERRFVRWDIDIMNSGRTKPTEEGIMRSTKTNGEASVFDATSRNELRAAGRRAGPYISVLAPRAVSLLLTLFFCGTVAAEEVPAFSQPSLASPSALSMCIESFKAQMLPGEPLITKALFKANLPVPSGPLSLSTSRYGYVRAMKVVGGAFFLPLAPTVEEQAIAFLDQWSCLTGVETDADWSLVLDSMKSGPDAGLVLRFHQAYGEYPLFGSEVVMWINSNGNLEGILNRTVPIEVLQTAAFSFGEAAVAFAEANQSAPQSHPGIFHPSYFEPVCDIECLLFPPVLAARAKTTDLEGQKWSFSSPKDGVLLGNIKLSKNDLPTKYGCSECVQEWDFYTPEVCAANDPTCSECTYCTGPVCQQVCSACELDDDIYNFLLVEFGRDSWDDGDAPLGLVPECGCTTGDPDISHELQIVSDWGAPGDDCTYCNATTFFPDGPVNCTADSWVCGVALGRNRTCLDVAMHEVSHLVNLAERRLGINGQSSVHCAAVEEGFCDILGEGAESWLSPQGVADWVHGTGGTCLPTRNMSNPEDSDTYGTDGLCGDFGPVALPDHASMFNEFGGSGMGSGHFNATILGQMANLLARPADDPPINHWGIDVYGVGEECVRNAFYSAFKHPLLPADATYSDLWSPVLSAFLSECGVGQYVRSYIALAAMGFWIPLEEMRWNSEYAISTEYYPTHPAHPYWVFMNIGDDLVAFGRECRVSESCPYTVQILGQTERGISTIQYDDEIHVFALGYGSDSPPVYHWKIGSDGVAVALGLIPGSRSDRTPSAINKDGTMYVVFRDAATSQVRFARFVPDTPPVWEIEDTPFSTPGATGAVVTPYYTYLFYPDQNWDMQYQLWANWDDDVWLGPSPFFPGTPYREMSGEEPPGCEWYKDRLHLSYPSERTGGGFTVYGSCSWPCWSGNPWTLIGKVDGRDLDSLWVYLNGYSQNDSGLYQFRGWENHGVVDNVTWRWKASE